MVSSVSFGYEDKWHTANSFKKAWALFAICESIPGVLVHSTRGIDD